MDQPKWLAEAWRELGQREGAGAADNARILKLYRDAGHTGAVHDEVPWCAAFAGACLERAGLLSTRSLIARSYTGWGEADSGRRLGAIAVLSRGGDPSLGHVGFLVGESGDAIYLLGGNQGDSVSVAAFEKSRLVALRWPSASEPSRQPTPQEHAAPSAAFERALAHVLEMEGGYTDDPHDPGGPTNKGILLRELADWSGVTLDAVNTETMKAKLRTIAPETVREIYLTRYWRPAGCAEMPAGLALMHFDAAVNHGVGTAARILQEAVGVEADGEIGPLTRSAIAQSPVGKTLAAYAEIRRRRYRALPHFWRFGRGWLARVDTALRLAMELAGGTPEKHQIDQTNQQTNGDNDMAKDSSKQVQPKWWGESMTIWGVIVTALSTVLPALAPAIGVDLPADMVHQAGEQVINAVQAAGGLLGTLMSIYGRFRASQPLERREMSFKV